tara:strand:+ start:522 stop:803 length:282 start_codon:yes stop_codon:yes gene_type:complete
MKMYGGRIPDEADGWKLKAEIRDEDQKWFLFEKLQTHSDEWITYKVVADGKVEKKANYWVVKNIKTGRQAYPADMELMKQHRLNLFKQIGVFL